MGLGFAEPGPSLKGKASANGPKGRFAEPNGQKPATEKTVAKDNLIRRYMILGERRLSNYCWALCELHSYYYMSVVSTL
uniref:Photosystem I assembly protein Ycf4-3 n=1 Tax=Hyalogonium fusiforme TaxID=2926373 RepID=A0A9E7V7E9_9CHLO|nr:photosystem I assembly protein Ycf4-3 [Hyalogonium fusiforme]